MNKFLLYVIAAFCVLAAFTFGAFYLFLAIAHMMWWVVKWAAIAGWIIIAVLVVYWFVRHFFRTHYKG